MAFTSDAEFKKGESSEVISNFIDSMMKEVLNFDVAGILINPWSQSFLLAKELIQLISMRTAM